MCLFTQDYAELSRFINKNEKYTQIAFLNKRFIQIGLFASLKQKRIIFAARRLASDLKSILKRIYRSTFFKHFARTVRNTKNRSIRIVFEYKFTIKPVNSQGVLGKHTLFKSVCVVFLEALKHYQESTQLKPLFEIHQLIGLINKTTKRKTNFFAVNA